VSRVRQFLSTPNYLEGHDSHHYISSQQSPHKQSRSKKGSQIPVYQPTLSAQSPQHHQPLSPNSRSTSIPPYSPSYTGSGGGGGGGAGDHQRISIANKPNSPGHISFSDELFINHSFQHSNFIPQHSPSNKSSITKQQQFDLENSKNQQVSGNKNGRKNFETFVMTGDAILNVSRNDTTNDSYKPSPTKTTSKLTPMPHMPVFVERDKDYNRRIQLGKDMEKDKEKSESDTVSPPLPPPPAPEEIKENVNDTNSYSSDKNKSDNLPPPPPPPAEVGEEDKSSSQLKNGHSNHNGDAAGEGSGVCNKFNNLPVNNSAKANNHDSNGYHHHEPDRCPEHQSSNNANNNEDTSISSSVMSDSGDEVGGDDEDVRRMIAGGASDSKNRIVLKVEARKTDSPESFDAERERDTEVAEVVAEKATVRERER
jgi:hypothetical protein